MSELMERVSSLYVRTHQLTSRTLSNTSGAPWTLKRKALTRAFTPIKLIKLGTRASLCCDEFMGVLEPLEARGEAFEVGRAFQRLSTDMTVRSLFGTQTQQQLGREGMDVVRRELRIFIDSLVSDWQTVIVGRRGNPTGGASASLQPNDLDIQRTKTQPIFSDKEIRANLFATLVDGFETISAAMTFMAYILAKHQDVQDKLRTTIIKALDKNMESYVETILRIEYLDQVTLEALRLYPPVAGFITRTCEKDYHYKGLKIPSGMTILIPVHQLHYDLNLWNQPEAFDPDRFSACNKSILNSVQYQAFGNGPRRCMGMRFAQLELKIAFAKILANYSLFLDERHIGEDQLKLKTSFIFANPRDGVWIKLKKVSRQSCDNKAS
ncbi:cytochrome P450, putative [Ixodes scapularis]|uniref:Cytochrome P450, putative n=1 Tax=Ixodes scapularis TaxID=6945 RepID=B7QD80_IXOSC|nr:cytochrome P450, putative [Ixodes scapularis]|eukprot:XP_002413494.1 cytochrome P450, putative [Ixodes scapularis]